MSSTITWSSTISIPLIVPSSPITHTPLALLLSDFCSLHAIMGCEYLSWGDMVFKFFMIWFLLMEGSLARSCKGTIIKRIYGSWDVPTAINGTCPEFSIIKHLGENPAAVNSASLREILWTNVNSRESFPLIVITSNSVFSVLPNIITNWSWYTVTSKHDPCCFNFNSDNISNLWTSFWSVLFSFSKINRRWKSQPNVIK